MSKGTGLGLSTVFGIVKQSGGHISVCSEPGMGSVFNVYLPHLASPAKSEAPATERRETSRGSGAVLVVEDQPEVRGLTCLILRGLGYEVLEAVDASDALAVAQRRHVVQSNPSPAHRRHHAGHERQGARRAAGGNPALHESLVYVRLYRSDHERYRRRLDNSVAFLQKPFLPDKLMELVQRMLAN